MSNRKQMTGLDILRASYAFFCDHSFFDARGLHITGIWCDKASGKALAQLRYKWGRFERDVDVTDTVFTVVPGCSIEL